MKQNIVFLIAFWPLLIFSQVKEITEDTTNQRRDRTEGELTQKTIDMILSQTISPSPNASEFSKVVDLNVNEYTGAFSTSIPLFNLQSRGVNLPISLNYQTSGVRVNEVPGNVGLGWSIDAGGVINRTVKGICDEMNYIIWDNSFPQEFTGYQQLDYVSGSSTNWPNDDYLPDEFSYSVSGHINGNFYFKRNREILEGNHNGYLIDEERFTDQDIYNDFISGFTIVDRQGLKYYFNDVEKQKTYSSTDALPEKITGNNNRYTSSFFLSEIINNSNSIAFTFDYTDYTEQKYFDLSTKSHFSDWSFPICQICSDYYHEFLSSEFIQTVSSYKQTIVGKRLNVIHFQDGYLKFMYNLARVDVPGDYALTSIELYDQNNNLVKGYKLSYAYFISVGGTEPFYNKRLLLTRIQEYGDDLDEIPPYRFVYNETQLAPLNSYKYDSWGYNNGTDSDYPLTKMYQYPSLNNLITPFKLTEFPGEERILSCDQSQERTSNNNALAGALEMIKYPTGGYQTIEYELNQFEFNDATYTGGGIRVQKITTDTEGTPEKVVKYSYTLENSDICSGSISLIPQYGYPCNGISNDGLVFTSNDNNLPTYMHEASIGYSCVKKEIFNADESEFNGTEVTLYHNIDDTPNDEVEYSIINEMYVCSYYWNFDNITNNGYPYYYDFSNEMKRGTVLKKYFKDNVGNGVKEISYDYIYHVYDEIEINQTRYYFKTFNQQATDSYAILGTYELKSATNLLEISSEKDIFGENQIEKTVTKAYDNKANISSYKSVSNNKEIKLEYRYIYDFDYLSHSSGSDPIIDGFYILGNNNNIDAPVETVKKVKNDGTWRVVDGELNIPIAVTPVIAKTGTIKTLNLATPIPETQFEFANIASDGSISSNANYEPSIVFDDYDPYFGQIRELHKTDDIHYVILWGYYYKYPVAKIVNATYDQIEALMINLGVPSYADFQLLSDIQLTTFFNNLRDLVELKNAQITSYTYLPLYGISSITDPRGLISRFEYDSHGRLEVVRDKDQKINQYIEYHYKPQDEPNSDCYVNRQQCLETAYDNFLLREVDCLQYVHNDEAYKICLDENQSQYDTDLQNCEIEYQQCLQSGK